MTLLPLVLLVVAFATLVTTHATLAVGLARRASPWQGLLAFIVPPLAPWWGWRAKMRVRGVLWMASALAYGVTLGVWLGG